MDYHSSSGEGGDVPEQMQITGTGAVFFWRQPGTQLAANMRRSQAWIWTKPLATAGGRGTPVRNSTLDIVSNWRLLGHYMPALNVAHAKGSSLKHAEVDAVVASMDTELSIYGDPCKVQDGRVEGDGHGGPRLKVNSLESEEDLQRNAVLASRGRRQEAQDHVVGVSAASVGHVHHLKE